MNNLWIISSRYRLRINYSLVLQVVGVLVVLLLLAVLLLLLVVGVELLSELPFSLLITELDEL